MKMWASRARARVSSVKGLSTKDAMKSCRLVIMAILSSSAAVGGADVGVGKLAIHASWRLVLSSKSKVA